MFLCSCFIVNPASVSAIKKRLEKEQMENDS